MEITYLGHSCLLAESENGRVIIDPFLSGNPETKVQPKDINVDAVLITHGHMDHIGDGLEIARQNDCPVIVIDELGKALRSVDESIKIHPLSIGGGYEFPWGSVKLTLAFHGTGVEITDPAGSAPPVGFLLTMGGKTLYHAGDTSVFSDMKLIGEMNDIHMAALPIGGNFTMNIDDSIIAAKMLNARSYMPIHFNTFDMIRQDVNDWAAKMEKNKLDYVILKNGDAYAI